MAYSKINRKKNKKITGKRVKKNLRKTKHNKTTGGSCGCTKINGGSPQFSDLSTRHYYPPNDLINDPNSQQISTRMADVNNFRESKMFAGANSTTNTRRKNQKSKTQKKRKQKGGFSYLDFSLPVDSVNNAMRTLVGSNSITNPSYLQNALSYNQFNPNSNIPVVGTQGTKYYV